ncbi:hypothetical protein EVAR_96716_1 [Eumeta japonica]|uniref:Uncharacterized protein n=1 Tax=Eumeta variegata TaxID=151549 RepID=A0A4C1WJG8_EUMVA|nr:hypothetical protein EVAR_96716_1 [Eumeta japonica]
MGSETKSFIRELGRGLRDVGGYPACGSCLFQTLSVAIQCGYAASVMETFGPALSTGKRACEPSGSSWSPPHMDTRDSKRVTSALPTYWLSLIYKRLHHPLAQSRSPQAQVYWRRR